ncbi:hypothetical protein LOCC1_G004735 [Lachnellula occidentalis]|uniref:Uncharacterized protein n=1 Tax=Lachnellula occidentalis TaxID=215460 RepID=A0A8H8UCS4_9HELO|nr:hypothetical protein LOCC1_G004735 [Lachnellula occidentalis]
MAKTTPPRTPTKQSTQVETTPQNETKTTLSDLQSYFDLWYRVCVLLYDLSNIATDRAAEARTLCTTDELYISGPYFTAEESLRIKSTLVSAPTQDEVPEFEALTLEDVPAKEKPRTSGIMSIEEAIHLCLKSFFEKRKASGDARPCGPHDMAPIYREVFGVSKDGLRDEKFLSRLRRVGLGKQLEEKSVDGSSSGKQKKKGGKKG